MLKFRWFYFLLIVNFLASISLVIFLYLIRNSENMANYILPMYIVWILLMLGSLIPLLIISIGHLRKAINLYKAGDAVGLRRGMKRMKLACIPYFIVNFIYFAVLALLAFAVSRGFVIFTPIPLIFGLVMIFTYIIMVFTSIYSLVYLALLKKTENMKWVFFILHIILQIVFVFDILDTIILLSWYPKDGKHGMKRTAITLAAIATILLLIGWLGWRELTAPIIDRNIENYPSADVDFAKQADLSMPIISELPNSAQLEFEHRIYQRGFFYWQSVMLTATYDQQTYLKEKDRIDSAYDFMTRTVDDGMGFYYLPAATFSISDYKFRVIDPPGDEMEGFPNFIGMIATSDKDKEIVYLYCEDGTLQYLSTEAGQKAMVKYVEKKYPHFWE